MEQIVIGMEHRLDDRSRSMLSIRKSLREKFGS